MSGSNSATFNLSLYTMLDTWRQLTSLLSVWSFSPISCIMFPLGSNRTSKTSFYSVVVCECFCTVRRPIYSWEGLTSFCDLTCSSILCRNTALNPRGDRPKSESLFCKAFFPPNSANWSSVKAYLCEGMRRATMGLAEKHRRWGRLETTRKERLDPSRVAMSKKVTCIVLVKK